jgi:hypothetical protein
MSHPVVHFNSLADLVAELAPRHGAGICPPVRVTVTQRTAQRGTMPVYTVTVAADVRVFCAGIILSYRAWSETFEMFRGDTERAKLRDNAWTEAIVVADDIRDVLVQLGHVVRPGVLDMGDVDPVAGEPWVVGTPFASVAEVVRE